MTFITHVQNLLILLSLARFDSRCLVQDSVGQCPQKQLPVEQTLRAIAQQMDQLTVAVSFAMESDGPIVTRGGFTAVHVYEVLAVPHEQLFLLRCEKQVS